MTRQALVIGSGGHCRVVLSLLASCRAHEVIGILDLEAPRAVETIMGVSVVGSMDSLERYRDLPELDVFLAVGHNGRRREWWETLRNSGFTLPTLRSPQAVIDPRASLGDANVVCARAFIGPEAVIGDDNLINTGAIVEHEVRIGSHCHLAPASTIAGRSRVGDGSFIGAGATVIDGITIGAGVTVGAGATVVRDIDDLGGVYVGTPAVRLRPTLGAH